MHSGGWGGGGALHLWLLDSAGGNILDIHTTKQQYGNGEWGLALHLWLLAIAGGNILQILLTVLKENFVSGMEGGGGGGVNSEDSLLLTLSYSNGTLKGQIHALLCGILVSVHMHSRP